MSSEIIGSGQRLTMRCDASSVAVGSRRLFVAVVMGLCAAGPAIAGSIDPAAPDIEGRWVAKGGDPTLDLSRCKEGWCGVEVTDANCGKTALRLSAAEAEQRPSNRVEFIGRFERAAETQPYAVRAHIVQNAPAMQLLLVSHSGDRFEMLRRVYPLNMLLVRSGEAQCRPDSKLS
jgi:hypothetical protein